MYISTYTLFLENLGPPLILLSGSFPGVSFYHKASKMAYAYSEDLDQPEYSENGGKCRPQHLPCP